MIEDALNQHHLQAFALPRETMRLDSTTAAVYHEVEGHTLIGYGHSKNHRPDLAQIKTFVAALDPLALPVVTQPLAGNLSDDPLYVPAIDRVRESLGSGEWLYVGDTKMEKVATRAHIVKGGEYYLLPLSRKHHQGELLEQYVPEALADEGSLEILASDEKGWRKKFLRVFVTLCLRGKNVLQKDSIKFQRIRSSRSPTPALALSGIDHGRGQQAQDHEIGQEKAVVDQTMGHACHKARP